MNLPEGLEYIDAEVFYNTGISEIAVPESVRKIEYGAFASNKHLVKVRLPKNLRRINTQLFYESPIAEIVWPEHAELIDEDAFNGSQFEDLLLPEGVQTIGCSAFANNGRLRSVEFPATLRTVYENLFQDCPRLTRLVCRASVPPVLDTMNSGWCPQVTLYVPRGSVDAYRSAPVWQCCKEIVEVDATAIAPLCSMQESDVRLYDLRGQVLKGKPSKGIYLKNGRKNFADSPR